MSDLPLEKVFYSLAKDQNMMPNRSANYPTQYQNIVDYLRTNVYPRINEGLSTLSDDPGIYTDHGPEHFDEVVKYAGLLLGVADGTEEVSDLGSYELYILLMAIRMHDAGNAFGRESHEKQIFKMLKDMGTLSGTDDMEKKIISDIGQAHGGKTVDGDKDTIGRMLKETVVYDSHKLHARKIAAIVRFADEICESRNRSSTLLLSYDLLPNHSQKYHKYAECIRAVNVLPNEKEIYIYYVIEEKDAVKMWGGGTSSEPEQAYIVDEILTRLTKMNNERIYCNRFMRSACEIERIKFTIEIVDEEYQAIKTVTDILKDDGYPNTSEDIHDRPELKPLCGASIKDTLEDEKNTK